MEKSAKEIMQIAFTYIGTVVGAGFASGREILEFFVQYGTQGFIGILLASLLFIWAGVSVMIVAHRIKAESYQDISSHLFGETVGTLFNLILLTILLGTTSVMLAATGAVFMQTFQLSGQIGIWLSMIFIYLVTKKGLAAIHSVNSFFVPILIGFTCLVFYHTQPWASPDKPLVEMVKPLAWLSSPLYYVALNVSLTQAVLVPIGRESKSEKTLIWGGVFGGVGIGLLLLLAFFSISTHFPMVQEVEMPMIFLLTGMGQGVTILFAVLVYAEIFSSLVANVFGLAEQLKQMIPLGRTMIICFILGICYVISFIGFGSLLTFLYPLFGQFVVLFLFMLFIRQWSNRTLR
jgi:uncharacterized membrane protein YkvI